MKPMNALAPTGSHSLPFRAMLWVGDTGRALVEALQRHAELYLLAGFTYAASLLQSLVLGVPLEFGLAAILSTTTLLLVMLLILIRLAAELFWLWRSNHVGSTTPVLLRALFEDILAPERVANGVHALIATGIFAVGFTVIKANIPHALPFALDETLMRVDQALHFGTLPHEWLTPLLRSEVAIFSVNLVYNSWYFVLLGFFMWQGLLQPNTPLRQRYLLAYLLSWALGTLVLGTLLSSAGPCFYGRLVAGPDPYAGLMEQLAQASREYPVWALNTQDMLWQQYIAGKGEISGISAMPSMHVATSVLFLLCARSEGVRWLTWFCAVFAAMILLGSVLLGWHYAVDGYAGALVAIGCWKLAGWWVKRSPLSSRPS